MTRQLLVIVVLSFFVVGCDISSSDSEVQYPSVVLREEQGFSVISEQHTYYRTTGSVVEYGAFQFKLNGALIEEEVVSNALFPSTSNCRSPFYTIHDIRLLSNNSVLALMSTTNPNCDTGRIYLAKISPNKNQLQVERIPIVVADKERGLESLMFYRSMPDGYGYGYEGHDDRLAVQRKLGEKTAGVLTAWDRGTPSHMILIDLETLKQIDMGEGTIDRFVENEEIALIRQRTGSDASRGIQFKAVRSVDGEVIDHAQYLDNCFRPVGKLAMDKAISSYGMWAMDEEISSELARKAAGEKPPETPHRADEAQVPDSLDVLLSGRDIDFGSDTLSGISLKASNDAIEETLLGKESQLEWDETARRIKVTISPEIRQIEACRLATKR